MTIIKKLRKEKKKWGGNLSIKRLNRGPTIKGKNKKRNERGRSVDGVTTGPFGEG